MIGQEVKKQLEDLNPSQETILKSIDEEVSKIELTLEETEEAIEQGRKQKFFKLRREEYNERVRQSVNWQRPNARELYEKLLATKSQSGDRFQVVDWNRKVIHDLCLYFAGDPKFEERANGFSLDKGIAISGMPGTGKTHLMNFFAKNPHQSYIPLTCKLIADRYRTGWKRDDIETLEYYSQTAKAEFGHVYDQTHLGYCFGDLGTEDEKKNYGNAMNVMEHVIFQRYENKLPFNMTHFTTNLNADELEKSYGIRIRDRLKEMCNQFNLVGESWR